ncbi:uncharacterized protein LOC143201117 [Rhynchophorus ferrugineus]|uniref:uncharacterized protein LOC143201117 n=1 Tax=Rhynchophorus ferrugineus TaxID=354439 RepID=UPI003FCD0B96
MSQIKVIDSLLTQECKKYKIDRKISSTKKPPAKRRRKDHGYKNKNRLSPEVTETNNEEIQFLEEPNLKRSTESGNKVPFPHITKSNWKAFNTKLFNEDMDPQTVKIKKCLNRMQSRRSENFHFTTCHYIRKTIIDSLLKRDWDVLTNLLIIFIERYNKPLFMPFIRQICDILQCHHPKIKGTNFEDQLTAIKEKYSCYRDKRKNTHNTV